MFFLKNLFLIPLLERFWETDEYERSVWPWNL